MNGRVRVGVVLAAMAVAVTATTGSTQAAPEAHTPAKITWHACAEPEFHGMDCATLPVPTDWSRPWQQQTALSLLRRPAGDPAQRIGTMLMNDGSGGSSMEQLRYAMLAGAGNTTLAKRYDLVAVDPRGVGHSSPIRCDQPARTPGVTSFPTTEAQFTALAAQDRKFADSCRRQNGALLGNLDKVSVAKDMEAVRIGLGERQVGWYGIQYSTALARTYSQLFPGRLSSMVLDTAVDDSQSPVTRLAGEIMTAEDSFSRFAAWCRAETDTAKCSLAGQDVSERYDRLVADADRKPIATKTAGRTVSGEDIRFATQDYLSMKSLTWPRLADAIKQASAGDATAFTVMQDKTVDPVQLQVTGCADTQAAATTYPQFAQLTQMAKQLSPHLGGAVQGWTVLAGCIGWPAPKPAVDTPVRQAPPALILQSTHQSLSPYSSGFGLSAQLPGSTVLTRTGDDYSMYLFSPCVLAATDHYLTSGQLPAAGTVCTN